MSRSSTPSASAAPATPRPGSRGVVWAAAALLFTGCLPADDRPDAGRLRVVAMASEETTAGVSTADGWTLSFDKLLVEVGGASIYASTSAGSPSDPCVPYSDKAYTRLLSLTEPGPQKVADVFGLGSCTVWSEVQSGAAPVRGAGLTAADVALMQAGGPDVFNSMPLRDDFDPDGPDPRPTLYLRGRASRGAEAKSFAWGFEVHGGAIVACQVALQANVATEVPMVLHVEELFRDQQGREGRLRFDAMAAADLDGDQRITMAELTKARVEDPSPGAGSSTAGTLAQLVYGLARDQLIAETTCSASP